MPKKKPKNKPKSKGLGDDQKEFIENKVKELGSMAAVKSLYCRDDKVCEYALQIAENLYPEKEGGETKKKKQVSARPKTERRKKPVKSNKKERKND